MGVRTIVMILGFVLGNFIYQAMGHQDWGAASERSFFETVALGALWLSLTLSPPANKLSSQHNNGE